MRYGVGAGELIAARVGGVGGRWKLLLAGDVVDDVGAAQKRARSGEVVLSPEAWGASGRSWPHRSDGEGFARVEPEPGAAEEVEAVSPVPAPGDCRHAEMAPEAIAAYVPELVLQRGGALSTPWAAELRRLTIACVRLGGLGDLKQLEVRRLHAAVQVVQEHVGAFGGALDKIVVDEKGVFAMASFGHPPDSAEHHVVRAVEAARHINGALRSLDQPSAVGVATGRVLCGPAGNDRRRELAVFGPCVNLAVRLMEASDGEVLVAPACAEVAHRFTFRSIGPIQVKGYSDPIAAAVPVGRAARTYPPPETVVGRDEEIAFLESRMDALELGAGTCVVIEGEAGIGKSTLVATCIERAKRKAVVACLGVADPIGRSAPYGVWGPILAQAIGVDAAPSPESRVSGLQEALSLVDDEAGALAPLLAPLLGAELPENAETRALSGGGRADLTQRLLVDLLGDVARRRPLVIVLDDAHWADSASWAVAARLGAAGGPVMLVVATRPLLAPTHAGYQVLVASSRTTHRRLGALDDDAIRELVVYWSGLDVVDEDLVAPVRRTARGNPLFIREMTRVLRSTAADQREASTSGEHSATPVPESLEALLVARLDALGATEQLIAKAASVIGTALTRESLAATLPERPPDDDIEAALETLTRSGLFDRPTGEGDPRFAFHHALARDVAYGSLLPGHAATMHAAYAGWLERRGDGGARANAPVLAHHWDRAGDPLRACRHLESAGEQAFVTGAFPEAAAFLERAIELRAAHTRELGDAFGRARVARWERLVAESRYNTGDLPGAALRAQQALDLHGIRVERSTFAGLLTLLRQLAVQLSHLVLPERLVWAPTPRRDTFVERSLTAQIVTHEAYYDRAPLRMVALGLLTLNLAERGGPSSQLARALGVAGFVVSINGLARLSRRYFRRARRIADGLGDVDVQAYLDFAGSMAAAGRGRWEDGTRLGERALQRSRSAGNAPIEQYSLTALALADLFSSRFESAYERFRRLRELAADYRHPQHVAWGLYGMAECLLPMGRTGEALRHLHGAVDILREHPEEPSDIIVRGVLATAWSRVGEPERAREAAFDAIRRGAAATPSVFSVLEGYAGPIDVLLNQLDEVRPGSAGDARSIEAMVRRGLSAMRRYARRFPIGRARELLLRGRLYETQGRPARAVSTWKRALEAAQALSMPYDEALVRIRLARAHRSNPDVHAAHLGAARRLVKDTGAMALASTLRDAAWVERQPTATVSRRPGTAADRPERNTSV